MLRGRDGVREGQRPRDRQTDRLRETETERYQILAHTENPGSSLSEMFPSGRW